jgi:hypothetical protein
MQSKSRWLLLTSVILVGTWAARAAPVQVTTQPTYYPGERLEILITYTQPGVLNFSGTPETTYQLDGTYSPQYIGLPVLTQVSWTGTDGMLVAPFPLQDYPARFFRISRRN